MSDSIPSFAEVLLSPALPVSGPGRVSLSVWFVSYTILIYDYFCTLESEINDLWPCGWAPGLVLFYLNRYLPFLDIFLFLRPVLSGPISVTECRFIFPATFWLSTVGLINAQCIIILRTYAIWGRRRLIICILIPITIILFGLMLGITAWKSYLDYGIMRSLPPGGPSTDPVKCAIAALALDDQRRIALLSLYVVVFIGEAAIVILTIIRANRHVSKFSPRWVSQLYKNGIIYCICMLALSIANAGVLAAASYPFKPLLLPTQRTLHSIFSNRVLLLIFRHRKRTASGSNEGVRPPPSTYTDTVMDVFTSVYQEPSELGTEESAWKTRAQLEWVE